MSDRLSLKQTLDRYAARLEANERALDMNRLYSQACQMLASRETRDAFDLEAEPARVRDRYGRHRSGQSMLLARRLVEAGVPYINVIWNQSNRGQDHEPDDTDAYGWDTHNDIFDALKNRLLPRFDESFSALHRRPRSARPAGADARRLHGRIRPCAARRAGAQIRRRDARPQALGLGLFDRRRRRGRASAARSSAHRIASAPSRPPSATAPGTSPPPCSTPWASTPSGHYTDSLGRPYSSPPAGRWRRFMADEFSRQRRRVRKEEMTGGSPLPLRFCVMIFCLLAGCVELIATTERWRCVCSRWTRLMARSGWN